MVQLICSACGFTHLYMQGTKHRCDPCMAACDGSSNDIDRDFLTLCKMSKMNNEYRGQCIPLPRCSSKENPICGSRVKPHNVRPCVNAVPALIYGECSPMSSVMTYSGG